MFYLPLTLLPFLVTVTAPVSNAQSSGLYNELNSQFDLFRMAHNQFLISPERCVEDMLNGVEASFPGLSVDVKSRIVFNSQVNIIRLDIICTLTWILPI